VKTVNKIAFLVHEPIMYAHYSAVWAAMDTKTFVIVLLSAFSKNVEMVTAGAMECVEKIRELGYEYIYLDDLLRERTKFRYVVSNHCMGGSSRHPMKRFRLNNFMRSLMNRAYGTIGVKKRFAVEYFDPIQYIPLQVGENQIRFMYGADIGEGWSLQPWNEIYDLFLCHGPNDEAALRKRFKGKTMLMGYPRYDEFFDPALETDTLLNEFDVDRTKKTILWITTTGAGASSIPSFARSISGLLDQYNVIVRPHPIAFRAEPDDIELLRSLHFKIDSDALRNMNKLYKVADFVLCDYGGSAFSAIYLGKKLILLDVPGSKKSPWLQSASNFELYEAVPVLGVEAFHSIHNIIADAGFWETWAEKSTALFKRYFADNRGTSSRKAVEILSNLDSIIARGA
jgi:CDP-Glycerol:Poly(glycerophosphate) glycerophosphotransferase